MASAKKSTTSPSLNKIREALNITKSLKQLYNTAKSEKRNNNAHKYKTELNKVSYYTNSLLKEYEEKTSEAKSTLVNNNGNIISPDVPFYIELGNEKYLVEGFPNVPEEKVGSYTNLLEKLNIKYNLLKGTGKIGKQVNPLNDHDIIEFIQTLEQVHLKEYSELDKISQSEFLKRMSIIFQLHRHHKYKDIISKIMYQDKIDKTIIIELLGLYDRILIVDRPIMYPAIPNSKPSPLSKSKRKGGSYNYKKKLTKTKKSKKSKK